MEFRRRKSKISYTVMIVSDSAKKHIKKFHLKARTAGILSALLFLVLVFVICYGVYSSITRSDSIERSRKQMEQLNRLQEEKETLLLTNEELSAKISILSETVNQKVQAEEALKAENEERHLPKGFPLSGSAQIKTQDAAEEDTEDAQDDDEDNAQQELTADVQSKEVIFAASEGTNAIASGAGSVVSVDADTGYGNFVSVDHGNGYVSTYRNNGKAVVKVGEELERGAILFVIGEDNRELGYRIQKDGDWVDPMEMIEING